MQSYDFKKYAGYCVDIYNAAWATHHTFKPMQTEQAEKMFRKMKSVIDKKLILFETGYGPSGLPHIGTFGEVARTAMVQYAFETLTGMKTRLICFSDDMDGFRKVPDNVPNQDMLKKYLDFPLTKVPDPFGKHESFGVYNNNKLIEFLKKFNFEFDFVSSTECYKSGVFDDALKKILQNFKNYDISGLW